MPYSRLRVALVLGQARTAWLWTQETGGFTSTSAAWGERDQQDVQCLHLVTAATIPLDLTFKRTEPAAALIDLMVAAAQQPGAQQPRLAVWRPHDHHGYLTGPGTGLRRARLTEANAVLTLIPDGSPVASADSLADGLDHILRCYRLAGLGAVPAQAVRC